MIRATDGPRLVWLWTAGDAVHASLTHVGRANQHRLTPQELAHPLRKGLPRAKPAIRALTGVRDTERAIERVRSGRWADDGGGAEAGLDPLVR